MNGHDEPIDRMKKHGILIDGEGVVDGGMTKILLQIFSKTVIGPIFFEFIQRKGDEGFRRGQLPRPVRIDRGGPDPPRRARAAGGRVAKRQRPVLLWWRFSHSYKASRPLARAFWCRHHRCTQLVASLTTRQFGRPSSCGHSCTSRSLK